MPDPLLPSRIGRDLGITCFASLAAPYLFFLFFSFSVWPPEKGVSSPSQSGRPSLIQAFFSLPVSLVPGLATVGESRGQGPALGELWSWGKQENKRAILGSLVGVHEARTFRQSSERGFEPGLKDLERLWGKRGRRKEWFLKQICRDGALMWIQITNSSFSFWSLWVEWVGLHLLPFTRGEAEVQSG